MMPRESLISGFNTRDIRTCANGLAHETLRLTNTFEDDRRTNRQGTLLSISSEHQHTSLETNLDVLDFLDKQQASKGWIPLTCTQGSRGWIPLTTQMWISVTGSTPSLENKD
jgi:hypothetical protein